MAVKTIETRAVISAQDKTGSVFAHVAEKLRAMQRMSDASSRKVAGVTAQTTQASASRAAGMMAGARGLVGAVAAYGAAGQLKQSVSDWADLELAVTRLGNTGEVSGEKITSAIAEFRKLGPSMGVTAKEVAGAAETYVAAGIDFDKAIQATPVAIKAAKASGADLTDITGAGVAAMNNLNISATGLDRAFDIMAKGGKLGSFELKNMARELPSVASRAKALGLVGEDGLTKIVAMLETTRKTAATGEEAANNLLNFFDKITSQDTGKHFKKMGVDLEKELKAGKKRGKDYVETTLELVERLTKGDPFKVAQLFPDRQAREGIMALIKFKTEYQDMIGTLKTQSIGTNTRDFNRTMETARAKIDKMEASWNSLKTRLGESIGVPLFQPILDALNKLFEKMDEIEARAKKGDTSSDSPGQRKFNRLANSLFNPNRAGSSQSLFDPSVQRAGQDKAARDLEDDLVERMQANMKKIEELNKRVLELPQASPLAKAGKMELERMGAEVDALQARITALQNSREAISRLMIEGGAGQAALSRFRSLGINQPVGEGTGGPNKLAFPWASKKNLSGPGFYAGVNPDRLGGSNPVLTPSKPEPVLVSLDPASKVDVKVAVDVKASSTFLEAIEAMKTATAAGNAQASVGTVGKTGVGGNGGN